MLFFKMEPFYLVINIILAIVDISIIAFLLYNLYLILAQTRAVQVLKGLLFFGMFYIFSRIINLQTFSWFLDQISQVAVLMVIILFQPELRRVLTKIGQSNWIGNFIKKNPKDLNEIIIAVRNASLSSMGMLIVFERKVGLRNYLEKGVIINSKIDAKLLLTIFFDRTPLHDGAVIIKNDTIVAASCVLPLSETISNDIKLGTRHRAALGIAEETDAVALVVSEETGKISLAIDGKLYTNYDIESLRKDLSKNLGYDENETTEDLTNKFI